eukprot:TRINITY_DN102167_c0_g1_i1.p1 TRINITY_DN102167_c0_g1~~TRINITY_DN102167_c0_g1_i1.p1  ORF type:complete len:818 (+),score=145.71 TRINITY_DN102167_c0_g1_i1:101-2455(+)
MAPRGDRRRQEQKGYRQRQQGQGLHPRINAQIIAAADHGDLEHLIVTIKAYLPDMNLVNISTAVHRVAKMAGSSCQLAARVQQHKELEMLLAQLANTLELADPSDVRCQTISNVLWSLATLRRQHTDIIQALAIRASSILAQFKAFELSTTLWALAKLSSLGELGCEVKSLFGLASDHIQWDIKNYSFRCLATVAWAFATQKHIDGNLFHSISAQVQLPVVAHSAKCQEIANTVWAFGTANFHDACCFSVLAEVATANLDDFKPQEISNTLWGFASNGFFDEAFFEKAAWVLQYVHAANLQSQHLANVLWSFSRVKPDSMLTHRTFLALLPLCMTRLSTFKPQELSSTLLAVSKAFGKADQPDNPIHPMVLNFVCSCMAQVAMQLQEFSSMSLANLLHAHALMPTEASAMLVASLNAEVLRRCPSFDINSKVHLLKSYIPLRSKQNIAIVSMLANDIARNLGSVKPQELQILNRILTLAVTKGKRSGAHESFREIRSCLHRVSLQTDLEDEANDAGASKCITASEPDISLSECHYSGTPGRTSSQHIPLGTMAAPKQVIGLANRLHHDANASFASGPFFCTWQPVLGGLPCIEKRHQTNSSACEATSEASGPIRQPVQLSTHAGNGPVAAHAAEKPLQPPTTRPECKLVCQVQEMMEEERLLDLAKAEEVQESVDQAIRQGRVDDQTKRGILKMSFMQIDDSDDDSDDERSFGQSSPLVQGDGVARRGLPTQRWSVKNSFLHAEECDECDGNSSSRSTSVPRSMGSMSWGDREWLRRPMLRIPG